MPVFIVCTCWMIHPDLHFLIYQALLCPLPVFLLTYIRLDSRGCWSLEPLLPQKVRNEQRNSSCLNLMLDKLGTISTNSLNDLEQISGEAFKKQQQMNDLEEHLQTSQTSLFQQVQSLLIFWQIIRLPMIRDLQDCDQVITNYLCRSTGSWHSFCLEETAACETFNVF